MPVLVAMDTGRRMVLPMARVTLVAVSKKVLCSIWTTWLLLSSLYSPWLAVIRPSAERVSTVSPLEKISTRRLRLPLTVPW